jgi:hypothetical protein
MEQPSKNMAARYMRIFVMLFKGPSDEIDEYQIRAGTGS